MARMLGKGATVTRGGVSVSNILSVSFDQSQGTSRGATTLTADITIQLDDATAPLLIGDIATWVITPASSSWTMTLTDAEIISSSTPIERDSVLIQSISLRAFTTASPYA